MQILELVWLNMIQKPNFILCTCLHSAAYSEIFQQTT